MSAEPELTHEPADAPDAVRLPDGRLIHLELHFGSSIVMVADEFAEHGALSPATTRVHLSGAVSPVADVEEVWRCAIEAGATVHRPLVDAFWGDREGQIFDPFGHRWGLAQHVRDVSLKEVTVLAAQAFG